jgi:hypothetical protein
MSENRFTIDSLIYGKVDLTELDKIGRQRETNPNVDYSRNDINELISWYEWFEPHRPTLRQIRS